MRNNSYEHTTLQLLITDFLDAKQRAEDAEVALNHAQMSRTAATRAYEALQDRVRCYLSDHAIGVVKHGGLVIYPQGMGYNGVVVKEFVSL